MSQQNLDLHAFEEGFRDLVGYRLIRWEEDYAEVALELERKHMNRSGVLHGGVLVSLLDVACGYSGTWCSVPGNVRRAMTVQISSQFIAVARQGERLVATGRRVGSGKTIYFATGEVHAGDRLIGRGDGTFRYRRGSETLAGTPE